MTLRPQLSLSVAGSDNRSAILAKSHFLAAFRTVAASSTSGCVLMENPHLLKQFLNQQQAGDSSGRGTGYAELSAMTPLPCHNLPGSEIPEKHWAYRFAKKHCFFGFGAYG